MRNISGASSIYRRSCAFP